MLTDEMIIRMNIDFAVWEASKRVNTKVQSGLVAKTFQQDHRDKLSFDCTTVFGLVTKTLTRKDAEFHSPAAQKAIDSEISRLEAGGVWDSTPVEMSFAKTKHPTATY